MCHGVQMLNLAGAPGNDLVILLGKLKYIVVSWAALSLFHLPVFSMEPFK